MMTLIIEVEPPERIPSSTSHNSTIDPHQKAKSAPRKINKLKSQNDLLFDTKTTTCGSHGVVSVMGRRREMEDTVRIERGFVEFDGGLQKLDFYGVYDGHGGSHVAESCRDRVHEILKEEMGVLDTWMKVDWEVVIGRCFERIDNEVVVGGGGGGKLMGKEVEEMNVGSTVVLAVVGLDHIVVANCGDSRALLCRNGLVVPLSFDHKPDRPDELARIEGAGGRVINWNGHRVLGVLATSRSIGDHYLKPYVSSTPEITITQITDGDEFLILASDGLWDVITNEVACNVVRRCLTGKILRKSQELTNGRCKINSSRAEIAAALLVELALAKGSKDNISIIVVELRRFGRFNC